MTKINILCLLIIFSFGSCQTSENSSPKVDQTQRMSVMGIFGKLNIEFKNAKSQSKAMIIASKGLGQFEEMILSVKEIDDNELNQWYNYYRALEEQVLRTTQRTARFLQKELNSDKIDKDIKVRLAKIYETKGKLDTGRPFPELPDDTKDIDGKPVKISDYDNKLVLIDFWATWCGPCMSELPVVKKAYKKYKSQGFEILGISLDKGGDQKFRNALKKHDMTWTQICDQKGWQSEFSKHYGVRSIPATYLLKNGKIVAKNLRGNALEEAIKKHL